MPDNTLLETVAVFLKYWVSSHHFDQLTRFIRYWNNYACISVNSRLEMRLQYTYCIVVYQGCTRLKFTCSSNQEKAAEVLLDAGVDVNCRDAMQTTPLMIAAAVGHYRVLRILANHPQVDLHAQVSCTTIPSTWLVWDYFLCSWELLSSGTLTSIISEKPCWLVLFPDLSCSAHIAFSILLPPHVILNVIWAGIYLTKWQVQKLMNSKTIVHRSWLMDFYMSLLVCIGLV